MTENGKPRHLNDSTAFMPAVPRAPRHSADDPDRRGTPYLDSTPRPAWHPPTEAARVTRRESREQARLPWWKRWLGLTK